MFRFHRLAAALAALLVASSAALNAAPATTLGRQHQPGYRSTQEGMAQPHRAAMRPRAASIPAVVPAGYPRYRLIDLGTLGGPESNTMYPARTLNSSGVTIANSQTAVPEPNCFLDCYFDHAFLRRPNGRIIELPFPVGIDPAVNTSLAGDISANGQMGGFVTNGLTDPLTGFPQLRPVVWGAYGGVWDLGTFGGNSGAVNMVDSWGNAVGAALNTVPEDPDFAGVMNGFIPAATQARAFLWKEGKLQDLGTLGGNDAAAFAINGSGLIYGISYTDTAANDSTGLPTTHAFLWKNGSMRDLGTLGGSLVTSGSLSYGPWGQVLNERGQAIGTSMLAGDESWHAFLWESGKMIDLGTLGGESSEPLAINEHGWIVGRSDYSPNSPHHHAVLWFNGPGKKDLGVVAPCYNSTATAVNSNGDVVGGLGGCTDDPNDLAFFSAFVWRPGGRMVDLNNLVIPGSGMHVEFATGINDRGEIAANAYLPTGEIHGMLLVPVTK
jgi:probable HAF family extracellular repeat protein